MPEVDDANLVEKFTRGDESAFNLLVSRYRERIYALAWRMLRNREDAMDVTQEAFVKAYKGLGRFKGESSFSTWLYRIAMNLAINQSRRDRFRGFLSLADVSRGLTAADNPEANYERNELSRKIDRAVKTLPERQRAVFVMRYYQEMSNKEIAEILGRTEGSVKANYFQALQKLKAALGGQYGPGSREGDAGTGGEEDG